MTFMNKRQSRDRAVCADIASEAGGRLIITPYSERLFTAVGAEFLSAADPFAEAGRGDRVFIERNFDPAERLPFAEKLIVYYWNRGYPHDPSPVVIPEEHGFKPAAELEFPGKSHDRITKRIYIKI